jgi:hypothetical protein
MPDDLSVAVERLRTSTQRLNAICDTAAQVIREVESFLEESHVGVPAWVEVSREDEIGDGRHFTIVQLSYQRHKSGKFRIVVVTTPFDAQEPEDITARPWSECTRDEKIESLGKLPDLLVKLADRANEKTDQAELAIASIGALLQSVKKRKGG